MSDADCSALLIVDVQKDFCPGGALAVPAGDRVVEALNRVLVEAAARRWPIYASRDWHPAVTHHFASYGGEWPVHCVQKTDGARFHEDLCLPGTATIITKGHDAEDPGYSAFRGFTQAGQTFLEHLEHHHVTHLYVGGLATDYCVKETVLAEAIAGVDRQPGDSARAIAEMLRTGARVLDSLR